MVDDAVPALVELPPLAEVGIEVVHQPLVEREPLLVAAPDHTGLSAGSEVQIRAVVDVEQSTMHTLSPDKIVAWSRKMRHSLRPMPAMASRVKNLNP